MMLTIHGLPFTVKYHDLKVLIKQECKISDFILDNLVSDGHGTKKVQIGVSDDREGSYLIKCFDGYRLSGNTLRVVPVGKPPPTAALAPPQNNFSSQGSLPPRNDFPNQPGYDYGHPMDPMSRTEPMMRPDPMNRRSDMTARPDNVNARSEPMPGRSDPMLGRPDPMHGRSDPMNRRPDPMEGRSNPMPGRPDPWGPSSGNNQWSNQSGPGQPHMQQNINYQQPSQGLNNPYGQQRAEVRPFDQREPFASNRMPQNQGYGFTPKVMPNTMPQKHPEPRTHVLRSVEIIDEPIAHPNVPVNRYPGQNYDMPQKAITIMKDNFQGPQYNADRQSNPQSQYPGSVPPSGHAQGHGQPSLWVQPVQPEKSLPFSKAVPTYNDRKYSEPDKRQGMSKNIMERNINDNYNKGYDKGPGPRFSPRRDLPIDPHGRKDVPLARRLSPTGRRMPSPGRRISPPGRRMSPPGRRISPPGRRMSPSGSRMSPSGRKMSPSGRRMSPSGRRMSPLGRRISPSGRRASPSDRRLPRRSPGRRESPSNKRPDSGRRPGSPGRLSPSRRVSPAGPMRYSPPRRHLDKLADKYLAPDAVRSSSKDVRPAYDPPPHSSQAPNQAMYSGGYRPSINENVQYPVPGMRQQEQRGSVWQQDRDKTMFSTSMKKDDDIRDMARMPKFEPRIDQRTALVSNFASKKSRSPRKSRSPMRRDRSPLRDRYKKHSPSPRSPRRSWALEKRRSPEMHDAPPPPIWPGQNNPDNNQYNRNVPNFPERAEDDKKRMPVWDRSPFDEKIDRRERRPEIEERRVRNENPIKVRTDLGPRQPLPQPTHANNREPVLPSHGFKPDDRFPQRDKFTPREDFAGRRDDLRRSDNDRRPDFRVMQPRSGDRVLDSVQSHHADRREEFPRREEERKPIKGQEAFQREIDDVYKRAVEFNKKAEDMRRRDSFRKEEYVEDRSRREMDRHEPKDYDRQKIHRDEIRPVEEIRPREEMHARDEMRPRDELRYRDRREEPRHEFRHPDEHRRPDDQPRQHLDDFVKRDKAPEWNLESKREKAVEEIAQKMLHKYGAGFSSDKKQRVLEELKLSLSKLMWDMFANQDLSFIELVVKFNARFDAKDEAKIFDDVLSSFPSHYRAMNMKRSAGDLDRLDEIPSKIRLSPDATMNRAKPSSSSVIRKATKEHYNKPLVKREQKTIMKTKLRPAAKPAPNPVAPERKPVFSSHKYKTREHISAKLVQKTFSPVKRFVKTEQKSAKPEEKTTRPEKKSSTMSAPTAVTAAPPESKKGVEPAPVDPEPDGHYELNPLMTRMLESELQDIMIKVWQELPDEPLSDAEKLVTDKLRNQAGDDLRNVLGLNITKRLLNVYNPLFVKAEFSKKPENKHVKAFLYEFGCDRLLANNIIQMKNIADFDRICSAKAIRCGDAKVNIIPCYKFMRCPSKLKTIYSDINAGEKKTIAETAEIKNKTCDNVNMETKPDTEFASETKDSEDKSITEKPALNLKNKPNPEEKSIPDKPELTKTVDLKSKPDSEEKSATERQDLTTAFDLKNKKDSEDEPIPEKPAISKTVYLNKKIESEEKSETEKQALAVDLKSKADCEEKSVLEKSALIKNVDLKNNPNSEVKSIPGKPNEKPQKLLKVEPDLSKDKHSSLNTAPKEKGAEINKTKKSNDIDNSKLTKKVTDTKTVNMKKLEGRITKNNDKINQILASDSKNDDDELDDEDILALISEGIVLDECSGSDGE